MPFRPAFQLTTLIAAVLLGPTVRSQDWTTVGTPAAGPAQVIGTYTAGCVVGAVALPPDGPAYEAVRMSRNRHWGHPAAIAFTQDLTQRFQKLGLPHVYVGDISQPRGGPAFPLHASHQAGLDIDIWFDITRRPRLPVAQRETLPIRSMVRKDDSGVDLDAWQPGHVAMLQLAAHQPATDRIFVNKWIKRHLCESAGGDRSWLRKVTPWYGHDEHFHIRLSCPPGSPLCQPQAAMPAGDGCNDSLEWWFRPPPPPAPGPPRPAPRPRLPSQCEAVLTAK